MCKRVRCPAIARRYFTGNELYGWPDGIVYEPRARKRKKKRAVEKVEAPPLLTVMVISGGVEV